MIAEKPYLKARVQIFNDYTENESLLATLEQKVMDEVRYSVKIMKILYPQNNYTMNDLVLRYRPQLYIPGVRNVVMQDPKAELERRSKFSFATMDMLKTDPVTKLLFLQEPVLEKRYANVLKVRYSRDIRELSFFDIFLLDRDINVVGISECPSIFTPCYAFSALFSQLSLCLCVCLCVCLPSVVVTLNVIEGFGREHRLPRRRAA